MNTSTTIEATKPDAPNGTVPTVLAPAPIATAPSTPVATQASDEPARALAAFADEASFAGAQRMARALAASSLVPKDYQGNIPNVLIAMELANRIGASVFMVMQSLDVVHGRPAWRAQFLIATVNASGRFTPLRFRWSGKPGGDDWGCQCVAKDRESGEECVGSTITIRLAKAEGWYSRNGSKWLTMPEQMMMYRAAAFWTRVYAPELSLGMQTGDELQDAAIDVVATAVDAPSAPADPRPKASRLAEQVRAQASPPPAAEEPETPREREPGEEG